MPSILADEKKLRDAIENTESCTEALEYLGLRPAGGNFSTLKKYAKLYGVQLKPTPKHKQLSGLALRSKLLTTPLQDLLVSGKRINGPRLKRRLIAEGLLEDKCSECGIGPFWNEKPLSLQVDHVNGVHNDNRLENLRILCPNCHTQSSNFAGRNSSILRHCLKCSKLLHSKNASGYCHRCIKGTPSAIDAAKRRRKIENRPRVDELLTELEASNYSAMGRKYGVSDNAIRKWIRTGLSKKAAG